MSKERYILCDLHQKRMFSQEVPFTPGIAYNCGDSDCRRYFEWRKGYFYIAADEPQQPTGNLCPKSGKEHSYMPIMRRKDASPGDPRPWCWYCLECNKETEYY